MYEYNDQRYVRNLDNKGSNVARCQPNERKILIVDDYSSNIKAMEILLKYKIGLDIDKYCVTALGGKKAIELITKDLETQDSADAIQNKFELILMDLDMPGMNGYECTQKIREIMDMFELPQPVISAVTGITDQKHIKKATESKMNQIISKPINSDVLTTLI